MAKITNIPDTDNVLRYAKKTHLAWKPDDKGIPVVVGCFPALFELRDNPEFNKQNNGPEKSLSVNWIEFFTGDEWQQLRQTVEDFSSARTINRPDAFAKLSVREFKKVCRVHSAKVRIIHDAEKSKIKSHSSINQLPQDNALLFDDLCEMAFNSLIPAAKFSV